MGKKEWKKIDLTKGGDIIRSVTYEAFMPLIDQKNAFIRLPADSEDMMNSEVCH